MALQGQRFHIDLESDDDLSGHLSSRPMSATGLKLGLVGDIKERVSSPDAKPPSPPAIKSSGTGFPVHRTRTGASRFRRKRESQNMQKDELDGNLGDSIRTDKAPSLSQDTRTQFGTSDQSIDEENKRRLAQMSEGEIEEARRELMAGLSPSLIEKLLRKANIEEDQSGSKRRIESSNVDRPHITHVPAKKVTFEDVNPSNETVQEEQMRSGSFGPEDAPLRPPPDLRPASSTEPFPAVPDIHFPKPPGPPELDPSDPHFLEALHSTYYPSLPADPSNLSWMTPIDPESEANSVYSPTQQSLPPSALRFDFRGRLLPPRLSSQIPITKGLHHHGHAPSSAGYTIPELAHLARSVYPAQRCIAYQTLGRILYRLGKGDFGQEGDDLCEGLWQLIDEGRVLENLTTAASKGEGSGNRSVWVTATDAVWLWRQGGGRKWQGR